MRPHEGNVVRVLAIDPISRGFGFAVLEGPSDLVDWGVYEAVHYDLERVEGRLARLIRQYRPDVLVVEDCDHRSCRRRKRARTLIETAVALAGDRNVDVGQVSRAQVRELFGADGRTNKDRIASTVAEHFPLLKRQLPPVRKLWMNEDRRMGIFDAVAFGLACYFYSSGRRRRILQSA